MTIGSSLAQPCNDRIAILRAWQVSLCEGDHCAAMLMNHFDYWHSWKTRQAEKSRKSNDIAEVHGDARTQDQTLLQFHTLEDLSEAMMGLFGRTKIISSLKYLEHKEIITKHSNPNPRYTFDKTIYYLFHPEVVNNLYKTQQSAYQTVDVHKQPLDSTELDYRESKSVRAEFENVRRSSESERHTEITSKITNKEIKAEEADPGIQKIKQPAAAALSDSSLNTFINDLLIDDILTDNQYREITDTVTQLQKTGYLKHLPFEEALQSVCDTILSPTAYTQAGKDFTKKLNTVKKSIQNRTWTPPLDAVLKKEEQAKKLRDDEIKAETERHRKQQVAFEKYCAEHFSSFLRDTKPSLIQDWIALWREQARDNFTLSLVKQAEREGFKHPAVRAMFKDFLLKHFPAVYAVPAEMEEETEISE